MPARLKGCGVPLCRLVLAALATAMVAWIRLLPLERTEATLQYRGTDGRSHVLLGDFDSYLWLRMARNVLERGTPCDATIAGECRDLHTNAPLGARMLYSRSLHVRCIAWLHRWIRWFVPDQPLPASAFLVPVIVGALGVLPAFAIGWRLAGVVGALAAAFLSSLHPVFLQRSIGGDSDVWNVVLPLYLMWALIEALLTTSSVRAALFAAGAGLIAALLADIWSGWQITFSVACAAALAAAIRRALIALRRRCAPWRDRATVRAVLIGVVLCASVVLWVFLRGALGSPEETLTGLPERLLATLGVSSEQPASADVQPSVFWPDNFATVGELTVVGLPGVKRGVGMVLFSSGWLGTLILMLPSRRWRWAEWAIFVAGAGGIL